MIGRERERENVSVIVEADADDVQQGVRKEKELVV